MTDRPVDLLGENVDCVIRVGELSDHSLVARRVGQLPFVTVAAPALPAALRRAAAPERPGASATTWWASSRRARAATIRTSSSKGEEFHELDLPYRMSTNEANAHLAAVLARLRHLAAGELRMRAPHLHSGELVQMLPDWTREPLPVHVVYPPNRHLSTKVRAFVDWAAQLFAAHPQLHRAIDAPRHLPAPARQALAGRARHKTKHAETAPKGLRAPQRRASNHTNPFKEDSMRPWFKRSLFGFAGLALVAGSLAGCANHRERGWHGDAAEFRARMVERVGSKLELDAAQKQKLAVLAEKLQAQRAALRGGGDPRAEFRQLFAGAKLDQAAREEAGRGEDRRGTGRQPRSDCRRGRLLRQPEPRAAAEGARVHGTRRPSRTARLGPRALR